MITLSNLEYVTNDNGHKVTCMSNVSSDPLYFDAVFGQSERIDSFDAFALGMLPIMIERRQSLEITGFVSHDLLIQLNNYVLPELCRIHQVKEKLKVVATPNIQKKDTNKKEFTITGLSCGVDSFTTILNSEVNFDAFTFFDAGSHGIYGGRLKDINYRIRLKNALHVSKHLDIPLIRVKTNVYRLLKGEFKSAHSFLNLSCAIAIGLKKAKYYYASAYSTEQSNLKKGDTSNYDHLILPLIKYDKFETHPSVINLKRIERIKAISDDDLAQRYLDVCLSSFKSGALSVINCSSCDKCLRTALTLKSIGKLHLFYRVFDLKLIEEQELLFLGKIMFGFKTIHDQELIDLMSAQGQITKALKLSAFLLFLKDRVRVLPRRLLRPFR